MADITGQFEVDGIVKQREELERLMMRSFFTLNARKHGK